MRANVIEALGPIVETEDASASEIIHSQSPTMIDLLLKNAQSSGELTTSAVRIAIHDPRPGSCHISAAALPL